MVVEELVEMEEEFEELSTGHEVTEDNVVEGVVWVEPEVEL